MFDYTRLRIVGAPTNAASLHAAGLGRLTVGFKLIMADEATVRPLQFQRLGAIQDHSADVRSCDGGSTDTRRAAERHLLDGCAIEPLSQPALDSWLHSPTNDRQSRMNGLRTSKDWHPQQSEVAMEDRLLYRVLEVAVILNISRSKVYELFSSGNLESVKIDRSRLVRSSDLRAYVDRLRPVDKSA
jgi:excisionase family DNA binding protein